MAKEECKIFLSSSNRLKSQRDIVKRVVDEINENMGKYLHNYLTLYRWESVTRPKMGRPQEVIFEQSEYGKIDIYIGLIGRYLGAGTKEEFDEAYASYLETGKPEMMMFQDIGPLKGDELDIEQINKAQKFINDFKEEGEHPGLVTAYKNNKELEQRIRKTLTEYLLRVNNIGAAEANNIGDNYSFESRIKQSGITNFYVGRDEWQLYRNPPRLADYLMTATKSVKIATYWLAQGSIEGVLNIYKNLIEAGIAVEVVTINPTDSIASTLAHDVNETANNIMIYVHLALEKLLDLKSNMSPDKQDLFSVCISNVIPQAAVIFLDSGTENGRIQLEFRPYGVPRNDSFSMEISYKKDARLYNLLEKSWNKFFEDAEVYENRT